MDLSIEKCYTFEIVPAHKTWYAKDPQINVRDRRVPYLEPEKAISYFWARLKPWSGFQKGISTDAIIKAVGNI